MPKSAAPSKDTQGFDFNKIKPQLSSLLGDWSNNEKQACEARRVIRLLETNVAQKQNNKQLADNEIEIPRRIVDNNISREKPAFVAFIEQSARLVLFKSKTDPTKDATPLADWFTTGMRYPEWNTPWHASSDGSLLHGGVFIEVRIDESKPFGVAIESTPRDCLIFPTKTRKNIQKCEKLLRRYEYLPNELEDAVDEYGFDAEEVKRLTEKTRTSERETPIEVYKVFLKKNGIVYVAWWQEQCAKWLKAPEQLDMGFYAVVETVDEQTNQPKQDIQPAPCPVFPFFWLPQEIIENEYLLAVKGRAYKDLADQDALTEMWSSIVNGTNRASQLWASQVFNPANPEGRQNLVMQAGVATPEEIKYNNVPYPDPMLLTVAQALSTENMAQTGQVDFAVNNRQDSRKTAQEIKSAQSQAGLLSSVRLVPFSNTVRQVYAFVWEIVQSMVRAKAVVPPEEILPYFEDEYYVLAAGDTEVIKKAEKVNALQMFYPVVATTPVGPAILKKLLELQFPDEAPAWVKLLEQPDLKPIVAQLGQVLAAIPQDTLDPQTAANIQNILANAQSVLQQASVASGPQQLAQSASQPNPAQGAS